jgi:hypothetical protein
MPEKFDFYPLKNPRGKAKIKFPQKTDIYKPTNQSQTSS